VLDGEGGGLARRVEGGAAGGAREGELDGLVRLVDGVVGDRHREALVARLPIGPVESAGGRGEILPRRGGPGGGGEAHTDRSVLALAAADQDVDAPARL